MPLSKISQYEDMFCFVCLFASLFVVGKGGGGGGAIQYVQGSLVVTVTIRLESSQKCNQKSDSFELHLSLCTSKKCCKPVLLGKPLAMFFVVLGPECTPLDWL